MSDNDKALNNAGEEEIVLPEPPADLIETSGETTPTEILPTGEIEEPVVETEETPKKGATQRIRELNAKAKASEERAKSLEEQLAALTGSVEPQVPEGQYTPQIEPGQEYSPEQFQQEVYKTASSIVDLKVKQSEAVNRINTEAQQVIAAFPQLNPESDSFDSELSDSITEATIAYVRSNPYTASPKKFVERLMKPYQRAVSKEVGKASENIARQVSQAALRPTAITKTGEKPDTELSPEELEKKYGVVQY